MKKVLLAGTTGYLGSYIAKALYERGFFTRAIARKTVSLKEKHPLFGEIMEAEVTKPDTIEGCCNQIDVVFSTVGITRQKDGLTYDEVDYQANLNLLREAQKSGVRKFIYVSVLNGDKLRHLKICDAKGMFVEQLTQSGLEYCVIRPNGFFSDMTAFYDMAKKGRVYLFGNGELKANPIHGEDLAAVCVDAIEKSGYGNPGRWARDPHPERDCRNRLHSFRDRHQNIAYAGLDAHGSSQADENSYRK